MVMESFKNIIPKHSEVLSPQSPRWEVCRSSSCSPSATIVILKITVSCLDGLPGNPKYKQL